MLTAALAACVVTTPATAQVSPTAQKMGRAMDLCLEWLTSEESQMNLTLQWGEGFKQFEMKANDPVTHLVWSEGDEGAQVESMVTEGGSSCSVGPTRLTYPQMFMQAQVQPWLGRNGFQIGEPNGRSILTAKTPSLTPPIEARLLPGSSDTALRFSLTRDPW